MNFVTSNFAWQGKAVKLMQAIKLAVVLRIASTLLDCFNFVSRIQQIDELTSDPGCEQIVSFDEEHTLAAIFFRHRLDLRFPSFAVHDE